MALFKDMTIYASGFLRRLYKISLLQDCPCLLLMITIPCDAEGVFFNCCFELNVIAIVE